MNEFKVMDFLGFEWTLMRGRFEQQANGFWKVWMWVIKGPPCLTEGVYNYQSIPLPVFTEWWNE